MLLVASVWMQGTCRSDRTANSALAIRMVQGSGLNHGPAGLAWRPIGPPRPGSKAFFTRTTLGYDDGLPLGVPGLASCAGGWAFVASCVGFFGGSWGGFFVGS